MYFCIDEFEAGVIVYFLVMNTKRCSMVFPAKSSSDYSDSSFLYNKVFDNYHHIFD